jgi:hypothetical protein
LPTTLRTTLIACLLAFLTTTSFAATFNLKDRLKALQGSEDFKAHEAAVIEAGQLIKRQPRKMDGTWETKQIATILDFVFTEKDPVYRQQMVEMATVNFKDNRKAIGDFVKQQEAAKKYSAEEAKNLLYDIDAMIHQNDRGQDPPKSKAN